MQYLSSSWSKSDASWSNKMSMVLRENLENKYFPDPECHILLTRRNYQSCLILPISLTDSFMDPNFKNPSLAASQTPHPLRRCSWENFRDIYWLEPRLDNSSVPNNFISLAQGHETWSLYFSLFHSSHLCPHAFSATSGTSYLETLLFAHMCRGPAPSFPRFCSYPISQWGGPWQTTQQWVSLPPAQMESPWGQGS